MNDTLSQFYIRFSGKELPVVLYREDWVAALLFGLFIVIIFARLSSGQFFSSVIPSIFKRQQRKEIIFRNTFGDYISGFLYLLTTLLIIGLYIYTCIMENHPLSFGNYLITVALTGAFLLFKYLSIQLVGYIFLNHEKTHIALSTYFSIINISGLLLFPVLVLKIYFINGTFSPFFDSLALILAILTFLLLTIKIFQFFYNKKLDFVYILLYLCTLEIIPLSGMFQLYKLLIRDVNF